MQATIYTSLEPKLLSEWSSLWKKSSVANFINSPHWFLSVLDAFHYTDFVIIAIKREEELVAIAGLIKEKRYGVNFYTTPPGDFVCGTPFLFDSEDHEAVQLLTENILEIGHVFLDNVPETLVVSLKTHTSSLAVTPYSINLYLDFQKDEKGKVIIPKRKRLMREAKSVEEKFNLTSFTGENPEIFETCFQIDAKSRKFSRGYNAFSDDQTQVFYQSLAKYFKKYLLINILSFEEKPIVYEMGFLIGKTYFGSQIAFDENFRDYAPGKVLEVKLIEYLSTIDVTRIDYGSGDNYIKRTLTSEFNQLYKVVITKNVFIRIYIKVIYQLRDYIFNALQKHVRVYSVYRSIRKTIGL